MEGWPSAGWTLEVGFPVWPLHHLGTLVAVQIEKILLAKSSAMAKRKAVMLQHVVALSEQRPLRASPPRSLALEEAGKRS